MFSRQPNKEQQTKDILERGSILHMALQDTDGFLSSRFPTDFPPKKGRSSCISAEKKGAQV